LKQIDFKRVSGMIKFYTGNWRSLQNVHFCPPRWITPQQATGYL